MHRQRIGRMSNESENVQLQFVNEMCGQSVAYDMPNVVHAHLLKRELP